MKIYSLLILACILTSCVSNSSNNQKKYCGYELTDEEYYNLNDKIKAQESAYDADTLWQVYDQINDSVRAEMPDSVIFEVFLLLLNENEVCIQIITPNNPVFFEKIICKIMNGNYKGKIPAQRYVILNTYTNPDGSGDTPLAVAVKRKK